MEYCPNCESILLPEKREGKVVLTCHKCKYVSEVANRVVTTIGKPEQAVIVLEKQEKTRSGPKKEYWST